VKTTSQAEVSDATRATSFSPRELARISASHAATGSAWERMRRQQRREFSVCRVAVPVRWRFASSYVSGAPRPESEAPQDLDRPNTRAAAENSRAEDVVRCPHRTR
jgi:hypothetical protein